MRLLTLEEIRQGRILVNAVRYWLGLDPLYGRKRRHYSGVPIGTDLVDGRVLPGREP